MRLSVDSGKGRKAEVELERGGSNVIHGMLHATGAVDLFDELFEGEGVEDVVGGGGEAVVDETDGEFAGGEFLGGGRFFDGEAALEAADEIADADFARGSGQAVAPTAADFAVEETAAAEGEEDGLEELIGQVFLLGQVAGLDVILRPEAAELNDGAKAVLSSLGKAHAWLPLKVGRIPY